MIPNVCCYITTCSLTQSFSLQSAMLTQAVCVKR